MLPTISSHLSGAIDRVAELHAAGRPVQLRVVLKDGEQIEGALVSQSQHSISLLLPDSTARLMALEDIQAIYLAERSVLPTFILVSGVIVTSTAALVGLYSFPALHEFFPRIAGGLAALGLVGIVMLERHTPLRSWLLKWRPLFGPDRP